MDVLLWLTAAISQAEAMGISPFLAWGVIAYLLIVFPLVAAYIGLEVFKDVRAWWRDEARD